MDCPGGVCPVPWATSKSDTIEFDNVNHPSHYTDGNIECIEAIEAQLSKEEYRGYLNKGNPQQDLQKCQWYLNRLLTTYDD
jgi:hypothetical protein